MIICGHGADRPSTKDIDVFCINRYNTLASNKKRKQLVSVKRLKGGLDGKMFHDTYKTILGRNYYSQTIREYVYTPYKDGKYYSDCSSSGCATYQKCGVNIGLLNTAGIYNSSLFEDVPVKIVDGVITNKEILKVGDALLFVGNDPERPLQIGHVEYVYELDEPIEQHAYDPAVAGSYKVITDLNMRADAGTAFKIIDVLKNGAEVRGSGYYSVINGTIWIEVIHGNVAGYVSSKFVTR